MSAILLLDWANISGGTNSEGWQLNLSKLPAAVGRRIGEPIQEGVIVAPWREGGAGIVGLARYLGYSCATRPMPDHLLLRPEGKRCNLDVEFTIEALRRSPKFTSVVLGSADGDFLPLANRLAADGKTVYVLGHAACASRSVRESQFRFLNVSAMREDIEYTGSENTPAFQRPAAPEPLYSAPAAAGSVALIVDLPCMNSAARRAGGRLSMRSLIERVAQAAGGTPDVEIISRDDSYLPALATAAAKFDWTVNVIPRLSRGPELKAQPDVVLTMAAVDAGRTHQQVALATGSGEFYRVAKELAVSGREVFVAFPEQSCSRRLAKLVGERFISLSPDIRAVQPSQTDTPAPGMD